MARVWEKENFPHVESYADKDRPKYGRKFDRYYRARFRAIGKIYTTCFGWSSSGWTSKKAYDKTCIYKENIKRGEKPTSWAEEQEMSRRQARLESEKDITLNDYWEKHYFPDAQVHKKSNSYLPEQRHFNQWLSPAFGEKPLHEITDFDLADLRNSLLILGKAPRTVQYAFSTFRLVWNHARRRGLLQYDCPVKAVPLGKIQNERTRFLTSPEIQELLSQLKEIDINSRDFAIVSLNTGARRGELMKLRWKDVDFEEREIRLIHTKTGEPRTLPMVSELRNVLLRRQSENISESDFVFCKNDGSRWNDVPNTLRRIMRELFNQGIDDPKEKVCVHTLRHTAASHMLRGGVDVRTIQSIFGWSTLQMLQRYTHVMNDQKEKTLNSLEASYRNTERGKVIPLRTGTSVNEGGE